MSSQQVKLSEHIRVIRICAIESEQDTYGHL
jgi:hypothetical protein